MPCCRTLSLNKYSFFFCLLFMSFENFMRKIHFRVRKIHFRVRKKKLVKRAKIKMTSQKFYWKRKKKISVRKFNEKHCTIYSSYFKKEIVFFCFSIIRSCYVRIRVRFIEIGENKSITSQRTHVISNEHQDE
jgi:hypothetical protein